MTVNMDLEILELLVIDPMRKNFSIQSWMLFRNTQFDELSPNGP